MCVPLADDHPCLPPPGKIYNDFHQLFFAEPLAADQAGGIVYALGVAGDDRLQPQERSDGSGELSDAAAALQIFQRIHVEEDVSVFALLRQVPDNLVKGASLRQPFCGPDGVEAGAQRDIEGIEREDLDIVPLR